MRKIIHIDMDCFYAAVEAKHRPELRGKPLGIGGPPNSRIVLCTASYEARKYNVRAAMPSSQAVRLCPQLILIAPNFDLYKKESRAVREILDLFTTKIEPLSLDEAYLDVTECPKFSGSATRIAQEIRRLISMELHLTASAGVAPNKFLAKVASDWKKPNGQFVILPEQVERFVAGLEVEKIPGVGKVTARKMHELGLKTCGDIQKVPFFQLSQWFGSWARQLSEIARGVDERPVETRSDRKSLTVEETFATDLTTLEHCLVRIPELYEDWQSRMMKKSDLQNKIRGYVVKVKYHDFKCTTHERSGTEWPHENVFTQLLQEIWHKRPEPVRLIGLGVRLTSTPEAMPSPQLSFVM